MKKLLLLILSIILISSLAYPAERTTIGVIRYDGWGGVPTSNGPGEYLQPSQWHYLAPFYAQEISSSEVSFSTVSTQAVMDQEIAYAKAGGIDYFAFDYYPSITDPDSWGGNPNAGLALYRSSTHKSDVKYCIDYIYYPSPAIDNSVWVSNTIPQLVGYFGESNYQKVLSTRPLLYLYLQIGDFYPGAAGITALRNASVAAGYGNPYIVVQYSTYSSAATKATTLGADAITNYHGGSGGTASYFENRSYAGATQSIVWSDTTWWNGASYTGKKVIPNITAGWDTRPQFGDTPGWGSWYYTDPTPTELTNHIGSALDWVQSHASVAEANTILIYAWNEFGEGGGKQLCPKLTAYGGNTVLPTIKAMLDLYWGVPVTPPTVTISATDNTAAEAGLSTGTFTVSRTESTVDALTVYYTVTGTATSAVDYQALSGSLSIPTGASSATITLTPIEDLLVEGNETVIVTLTANAAYTVGSPSSATVTIFDNDYTPPLPSEGPSTGKYPHIKLGHYHLYSLSTAAQQFMRDHYDFLIWEPWYGNGGSPSTAATLMADNNDLVILSYVAGTRIRRWSDRPIQTTTHAEWLSFLALCTTNGWNPEDAFMHYQTDQTFVTSQPYYGNGDWSTDVIAQGWAAGIQPGYPGGTGTARAQSRVLATPYFYYPSTRTSTISASSGAVRSSNVVTITTTSAHYLYSGDTITISGVTNTSFNGTKLIILATPTATTLTYAQTGANATSANGTLTYSGCERYTANPENFYLSDVTTQPSELNSSAMSPDGYKTNGLYYDSMLTEIGVVAGRLRLGETVEYLASGYDSVDEWLTDHFWAMHERARTRTATWLDGTKTAYFGGNGDDITSVSTRPYYQSTLGSDYTMIELGIAPDGSYVAHNASYDPFEIKFKNIFKLMADYNRKIIWCARSIAKLIYDPVYPTRKILNWANYSGYIYYTDDINTKVPPYYMSIGASYSSGSYAGVNIGYGGNGLATSLGSLAQGQLYTDISTGRVYAWFTDDGNPDSQTVVLGGGEGLRHFGLAMYYLFGRYGDNGFYFPFYTGSTYNISPLANEYRIWHASIERDVGQPIPGGFDYNGVIGTDLWGTTRATSDYAYLFWQGDGTTGEDGKWTSDWGTSLNTVHKVYARKFGNAYVFSRVRIHGENYITTGTFTEPVTFTLPFSGKILRGDNTLGPETNTITIGQSEGIIFMTQGPIEPQNSGITSRGATFR